MFEIMQPKIIQNLHSCPSNLMQTGHSRSGLQAGRTFNPSGSQGFFYLDEVISGSLVTIQLEVSTDMVFISYLTADCQPAVPTQRLTPTGSASGKCLEPLVLVCDSNAWTPDTWPVP